MALDAVLDCMLAGIVGPKAIAAKIGFTPELVEAIQNRPEMVEAYVQAKKSSVNSAIERLERHVHRNLQVMEDLTLSMDPRVRMEAARDQLNRTPGLAPGARVEIGPAAYKKMVERYLEPDTGQDSEGPGESESP